MIHNVISKMDRWFFGEAVLNKFYTNHQANTTYLTNHWMAHHDFLECIQGIAANFCGILHVLFFDQLQGDCAPLMQPRYLRKNRESDCRPCPKLLYRGHDP